jgi:hypothetical protein
MMRTADLCPEDVILCPWSVELLRERSHILRQSRVFELGNIRYIPSIRINPTHQSPLQHIEADSLEHSEIPESA